MPVRELELETGSRSCSPDLLSPGELEAEWIFLEATRRRLIFTEACMLARNLESRSAVGAAYLRWLLRECVPTTTRDFPHTQETYP